MPHSVMTLGVDPLTSQTLRNSGFLLHKSDAPSVQEIIEAAQRCGADSMLFGLGRPISSYTIGLLRSGGVCIPLLCLLPGYRGAAWSREAAQILDSGGDDVIDGAAVPQEIAARLRAVLRRYQQANRPQPLVISEAGQTIAIDPHAARVRVNNKIVHLTAFEYLVLRMLADAGGPIARTDIWERLYGLPRPCGEGNSLDVFIHRLRIKLGDAAPLLKTLRGIGYELIRTA